MDQTAVVQPSAWDSFFGGLAGTASKVIDVWGQAEIARIESMQPTYLPQGGTGGNSAGNGTGGNNNMMMLGVGIAFALLLALALKRKDQKD